MKKKKNSKRCVSSPQNRRESERNLLRGVPYRWKPGQSGNPGGRPRYAELSRAYREILKETVPSNPGGLTYAEIIALRLATAAMAGSVSAAAELADRAEGKPSQQFGFDRGDNIPALVDALNRCADQIDEENERAERAAKNNETTDK